MLNFAVSKMKQGEASERGRQFLLNFAVSKMKQGEATKWLTIFFALFSFKRKSEKGKA